MNSTGEKGSCDFLPDGKALIQALTSGWWGASAQQFFRKDFYMMTRGLDTSIEYAVDLQLALLIGMTGCDTLHIPKVTYWRRIHPGQMSQEHKSEQTEAGRLLVERFRKQDPITHSLDVALSIVRFVSIKHPLTFYGGFSIIAFIISFVFGIMTINY